MSIEYVTLNGYDIRNLGFQLKWRELSAPAVKTEYEEIPGMNGSLDTSEANGGVFYDMRDIDLGCVYVGDLADWNDNLSNLMSSYHGKQCQIKFDIDQDYYWAGRVFVSGFSKKNRSLEMHAKVFPYKFRAEETSIGVDDLAYNVTETLTLANTHGSMVVNPTVSLESSDSGNGVMIAWGNYTTTLKGTGDFHVAGLEIEGGSSLSVSVTNLDQSDASIHFVYRQARL